MPGSGSFGGDVRGSSGVKGHDALGPARFYKGHGDGTQRTWGPAARALERQGSARSVESPVQDLCVWIRTVLHMAQGRSPRWLGALLLLRAVLWRLWPWAGPGRRLLCQLEPGENELCGSRSCTLAVRPQRPGRTVEQ